MILRCLIVLYLIILVHATRFNGTAQIYLDVKTNRKYIGRIVIGLFGNDAPRTVENFRQLCLNGINGKTYVGSRFHRIIDRFIIQGGDIMANDGTGSVSIYGKYFDDENLSFEHTGPGFIGMANRGPNTNGCQFYITTMAAPWLNGKHTLFGKVIDGQDIVHTIEKMKTDTDDKPLKPIIISGCGEIPTSEPFEVTDEIYGLWNWIKATGPPVGMSFLILAVFHYFIRKLNVVC